MRRFAWRRAQQRLEAAVAAWERAGGPPALRELAVALMGHGQVQEALDRLAGHMAWVQRDPELLRVWAVALRRAGRGEEAAAAFDRLALLLGSGSHGRHSADWARAEAMACRLGDRPAVEAAEVMRRLLLLPSVAANPHAVALYGRLLLRAGQAEAAMGPLLHATEALADDGGVAAAAAFAVRRARGPLPAMPLLMRALRIRPDQPPVLAALVADALRAHRAGLARRFLVELARATPGAGSLWNAARRLGQAHRDPRQGQADAPRGGRRRRSRDGATPGTSGCGQGKEAPR